MKNTFQIKGRQIGDGFATYIIAEMSANHAGSIENAKEIIHAAKDAGADCVKIQTYTPDTLTIDCSNQYFQVQNGTWEGENLYELYGKAYTPWEWQQELMKEALKIGIDFFSTPFDTTAVDFLEEMGVEFYKIASFEMIDLPLLKYVATKGKPIIMSTGMGTLEEIKEAVEAVYSTGNHQLALLKCSSAYPAVSDDMHLSTIVDMKKRFDIPIGLSDHSMGSLGAITAVAMGANIIEKHFCLSREIENPDASFSMTPEEFKTMVEDIRNVEKAKGNIAYGVMEQEKSSVVFRRSIFVVKDMKVGEKFNSDNTKIIRPGYGIKPKYIEDTLEMKANCDIARGTPFQFGLTQKGTILFLTNNENTDSLYAWLQKNDGNVCRFQNKLSLEIIEQLEPSFVISFNYRHLIPEDVIEYMDGKIVNLHASFLPYNRGSAPNFFSFYDNSPKGVTIHQMAAGLDTGDIVCQRELQFDEKKETFRSSYDKSLLAMMDLFKENWGIIKNKKIEVHKQMGAGSYHTVRDMNAICEKHPFSWDDNIAEWKEKNNIKK